MYWNRAIPAASAESGAHDQLTDGRKSLGAIAPATAHALHGARFRIASGFRVTRSGSLERDILASSLRAPRLIRLHAGYRHHLRATSAHDHRRAVSRLGFKLSHRSARRPWAAWGPLMLPRRQKGLRDGDGASESSWDRDDAREAWATSREGRRGRVPRTGLAGLVLSSARP